MVFHLVHTQRLYESVARQIADQIHAGVFKAGDRLPTERELAAVLGVSRPTVREAMIALELSGLVQVRTGAGVFVKANKSAAAAAKSIQNVGASPLELTDARLIIEPEIAFEASSVAEPESLELLHETLVQLAAAKDTTELLNADMLFHIRLSRLVKIPILTAVVEALWKEMYSPMFIRMGHLSGLFPDRTKRTIDEHQRIFDAIAAGRPEQAKAAMKHHLTISKSLLLGEARQAVRPEKSEKERSERRSVRVRSAGRETRRDRPSHQ
ncbi:MAG: FadR/GntR family transcriptional regulator [Dongiaceae bacterium]